MSTSSLPIVLIICPADEDWISLCSCYSHEFTVYQTTWPDLQLTSYSDHGCLVTIRSQSDKSFRPHLVVIRSLARTISSSGGSSDHRNFLYGFVHSGIPLINNLMSLLADLDRPLMYGGLRLIERRLGHDRFPLIPEYYYPSFRMMSISPKTPCVLKVAWPHAGYGKFRLRDYHEFEDFRTVVALHQDYVIAEPFIESQYEVRIVFIAPDYYRAHRREGDGWKVNMAGFQIREDLEVTPLYKLWCDEIRMAFGGLDMFAIDVIVGVDGKQFILEVNGSAIGFSPERQEQNEIHMRELVALRVRELNGMREGEKEEEKEKDFVEENQEIEVINLRNRVEELQLNEAKLEEIICRQREEIANRMAERKKVPRKNVIIACVGLVILMWMIIRNWK